MKLDDDLCVCFHVSKRKVINFLRVRQPQRPAQLSECQGAGTGCGWCRPYLERLFAQYRQQESLDAVDLPDAAEYLHGRAAYRDRKPDNPNGST